MGVWWGGQWVGWEDDSGVQIFNLVGVNVRQSRYWRRFGGPMDGLVKRCNGLLG